MSTTTWSNVSSPQFTAEADASPVDFSMLDISISPEFRDSKDIDKIRFGKGDDIGANLFSELPPPGWT
jgi:hypothetical protein